VIACKTGLLSRKIAAASVTFVEVNVSPYAPSLSLLNTAELSWNEQGNPVSTHFDDIYCSRNDGLDETRYVFLQHNGLPDRWATHDRPLFVIGETGFGTGLNFLTVWQAFRQWRTEQRPGVQRLHFISFEKYPISHADLTLALAMWPELAELTTALLQCYPDAIPGCHRLLLDEGQVVLDLWLGDIKETLDQLWHPHTGGLIDAWFLDGFAPSKNPEMWTDHLFTGLARLARPTATLSTFTCAGFVRRGLNAAGFSMKKVKGHGWKRQMLAGVRSEHSQPALGLPCYQRFVKSRQPSPDGRPIALIGGGIAAATLALALVRRGQAVKLFCTDAAPAEGASGNRQGAIYPLLNGEHDALSQFYAAAFGFARRWYQPILQRRNVPHDWCGVLQIAHDEKSAKKLGKLAQAGFSPDLVHALSPLQRDQLAGVPLGSPYSDTALYYPQGGWVCPQALTRALLDEAAATGLLQQHYNADVTAIRHTGEGWWLEVNGPRGKASSQEPFPHLVLANGHRIDQLAATHGLPCYPVRGQVSHLAAQANLSALRRVLCFEGYMTPLDLDKQLCLGASYGRGDLDVTYRASEQQENLEKLIHSLPEQSWPKQLQIGNQARIAIRCATRDHLPLIGAAPDIPALEQRLAANEPGWQHSASPHQEGLWLLGALGARGLCSAPLLAEILAAELCGGADGEPLPLSIQQLANLHPARSWLRPALRRRPVARPDQSPDQR
jgi:tRNA 5-methylaminomethyl-2-thiouridine biosynthesis bifunctional protein